MSVAVIEKPVVTDIRYWLEKWNETRSVSEARRKADRTRINRYVLPYIHRKSVARITSDDVENWMQALQDDGVGLPTIHASLLALRGGLEEARDAGVIVTNPARGLVVEGLQVIAESEFDDVFSEEELQRLLASMDEFYRPLVLFAARTGAKWDECMGLKTTDLFLDTNAVVLGRQRLSETMGHIIEHEGRPAEVRMVELPKDVCEALRRYLDEDTSGWRHGDFQWVFLTKRDHTHPLRPNFNLFTWRPALSAAGFDDRKYTFHDLRHTAAARWIMDLGWDVTKVARALGHKNIATTKRLYKKFFLAKAEADAKKRK